MPAHHHPMSLLVIDVALHVSLLLSDLCEANDDDNPLSHMCKDQCGREYSYLKVMARLIVLGQFRFITESGPANISRSLRYVHKLERGIHNHQMRQKLSLCLFESCSHQGFSCV